MGRTVGLWRAMTDNDKAAIAAGLWDGVTAHCRGWNGCSHEESCEHGSVMPHDVGAPDMHDPANLWRTISIMQDRGYCVYFELDPLECSLFQPYPKVADRGLIRRPDLFSALVALYDAEHPAPEATP